MRCTTLFLAVAGSAATAAATDAAVITNNPAGAVYVATFPNREDTPVRGSVAASSVGGGTGVQFQISISGLPLDNGPYTYHLHDQPVPEDGNCTKTLAHLDPYERGEDPACDADEPQTCQVGDLSGKHGKLSAPGHSQSYTDDYAALVPGIGAFFGNRSVVVHFPNKTRITCANFVQVGAGSNGTYGNSTTPIISKPGVPTATPSTPATTPGGTSLPSSGATRDTVFSGAVLLAAFAALML
ncbi:Cell surface Cu-only superoxide dismutase [Lasiodiplodia hormozganensis]|uniref:superoxide dismutase n=1 Tax=Lasiodiplodia hormozganensis TaxID=869390 RepID=A0AA39YYL6_9PEZI|nr:Cell surface Cu-only superoxide dismutase [Lasiodiplodia hormozganensis]